MPAQESQSDSAAKKPFYLPKNPVAAAYVLGRLSNPELIEAPRSEFVYVALLQRQGLDKKYRLEALEGLAKTRNTDTLTELIAGLGELDKKGEESAPVLRGLAALLLSRSSEELASKRQALENLSAQAQEAATRQIAFAGIITADKSLDPAWKSLEATAPKLADLVLAVALVRDTALRTRASSKVEPLLNSGDQPELRRAAITAMASIPGREPDTFKKLAAMIRLGTEVQTALASLQRIPKKLWPSDEITPLAESVLKHLEAVPATDRTQPEFVTAVQFATDLASLLPAEQGKAMSKILRSLGVRVVVIRTLHEQMLYDQQLIVVEAGKPVEILFENDDTMPHNFVVVMPGAVEEIGMASETMPPEPDAQGRLYVPASAKVLHATRLLLTGEKDKLSFTAPDQPADYSYVCTFPGHWRRMAGTLKVVKDLEEYLASHTEPVTPQTTEWKISDLAPDLDKMGSGRNLARGKQLFTELACAQCHKLGTHGYAFGPDLTDVFQRWKDDRIGVLGELIEPSKVINERYRNFEFELKNGDSVAGLIVKEDEASVTIQSGSSEALIQILRRADIQTRKPQGSSLMPMGLLSQCSKEQILDLLAFIRAGGKTEASGQHH
ncbi:MAG: c-type cytochrome [Verrucomicrobia bacterium]|nr:c-type cytochrome [Verrucomicrobiota bacterium]